MFISSAFIIKLFGSHHTLMTLYAGCVYWSLVKWKKRLSNIWNHHSACACLLYGSLFKPKTAALLGDQVLARHPFASLTNSSIDSVYSPKASLITITTCLNSISPHNPPHHHMHLQLQNILTRNPSSSSHSPTTWLLDKITLRVTTITFRVSPDATS